MKNILGVLLLLLLAVGLMAGIRSFGTKEQQSEVISSSADFENQKGMKTIYFAGGCFWGTEHFFKQVRGVSATEVGYANGQGDKPSYQEVSSGKTGFAETVKVVYDPSKVNLALLIDLYFKTVDPSSLNKQGNDIGTQYRTGIYYTDDADAKLIQEKLQALAIQLNAKVQIEASKLKNFYDAENYHQDYLDKNPGGYCHINPSLFDYAKQANPEK